MEKPNDKTPEIALNIFLHTFSVISIPILHHSCSCSFPTLQSLFFSTTPILQHSITAVLVLFHHSNTPSLHHSSPYSFPTLQYSSTPKELAPSLNTFLFIITGQ
jgi:hypothetical protein